MFGSLESTRTQPPCHPHKNTPTLLYLWGLSLTDCIPQALTQPSSHAKPNLNFNLILTLNPEPAKPWWNSVKNEACTQAHGHIWAFKINRMCSDYTFNTLNTSVQHIINQPIITYSSRRGLGIHMMIMGILWVWVGPQVITYEYMNANTCKHQYTPIQTDCICILYLRK